MDGGFWTLPWSTLGPGGILAIFVLLIGLGCSTLRTLAPTEPSQNVRFWDTHPAM